MKIEIVNFETQDVVEVVRVLSVSKVEQIKGNVSVLISNEKHGSTFEWFRSTYQSIQNEYATLVVGQYINGNYTAFVKQEVVDAIKDPDPLKHDSFIKKVVIGNAEIAIGDLIEGVQIASIEHRNVDFDKNEVNVFVAKNRHGACLAQTFVKHQDFSIVYGFRVMDESEIEWGESK